MEVSKMKALQNWYNNITAGQRILLWVIPITFTAYIFFQTVSDWCCMDCSFAGLFLRLLIAFIISLPFIYLEIGRRKS